MCFSMIILVAPEKQIRNTCLGEYWKLDDYSAESCSSSGESQLGLELLTALVKMGIRTAREGIQRYCFGRIDILWGR